MLDLLFIPVLMFIILVTFIFLSVPISFAIGLSILIILQIEGLSYIILSSNMVSQINSFVFLAVPFFVIVGLLMNETGMTERIFSFAQNIVGPLKGGLAQVNIVASIIFAGMSGAALADAAGLGTMEIEAMNRRGYDKAFTIAVTAASACIGPIIPPSIIIVLAGVSLQTSIAALLMGGIIPGLLMGLALMVICYLISLRRDYPKQPIATFRNLWISLLQAIPALIAPIIIIGGIVFGVTTPTEAGAIAVSYTLILGFTTRTLSLKSAYNVFKKGIITAGIIMFVVATAINIGYLLTFLGVPQILITIINTLDLSPEMFMAIVMLFFIFMGCFIDTGGMVVSVLPLLLPVLRELNINLIHFGIISCVTLILGSITPPVGSVMYILCEIGDVSVVNYTKEIIPMFLALVVVIAILIMIPELVVFIPNLVLRR